MENLAIGRDKAHIEVPSLEAGRWSFHWKCEKWSADTVRQVAGDLGLAVHNIGSEVLRAVGADTYAVSEVPGNLLLNEGIALILDLLIGAGGTAASNANARIGVGNSSTAAAATQTALQGASQLYKGMNVGYPARTAQTVEWQSDFADAEANFAWEEWAIQNDATAQIDVNRKVSSLGTKSSGTWTMTGSVTLS